MAPTCGSGDAKCAACRSKLGSLSGSRASTAGCGPSGVTTSDTGAFGGGAGQLSGSCQAVSAKLAECSLPANTICPSACEGECVQAASCSELAALFATVDPQGPLVACLEACPVPGGISSSSSGGTTGGTRVCLSD